MRTIGCGAPLPLALLLLSLLRVPLDDRNERDVPLSNEHTDARLFLSYLLLSPVSAREWGANCEMHVIAHHPSHVLTLFIDVEQRVAQMLVTTLCVTGSGGRFSLVFVLDFGITTIAMLARCRLEVP
jgi:hypothetical protein